MTRHDVTANPRLMEPGRDQWPVDVQRTDASGEFDLEQLEHNLALSPAERLEQASQSAKLAEIVREAGRRFRGQEHQR